MSQDNELDDRLDVRNVLGAVRVIAAKYVPQFLLLILFVLAVPTVLRWLTPNLVKTDVASEESLDLADFIVKVKSDLHEAEMHGVRRGEKPTLQLDDVELVASFVVRAEANGEVKLVAVNGSALRGQERSQQITLHMKPIGPNGQSFLPAPEPISKDRPSQ